MIIALSSALVITVVVWVINKKLPQQICPICAGVSLTWIFLYLGMYIGKLPEADYLLPSAIFAGGTVVGIMSKLENSIKTKFILVWKTAFTLSGFSALYGLFNDKPAILATGVILSVSATLLMREWKKQEGESEQVRALKEKMKSCC